MPTIPNPFLSTLKLASFSGIPFPWTEYSLTSSLRHYAHEYRYTPGDSKEKHGRKSYVVRFSAFFDEAYNAIIGNAGLDLARGFGKLYPDSLNALRDLFAKVTVDDLVVPTLGKMPVVITGWEERVSTNTLSGHRVEITFEEDREKSLLLDKFVIEKARGIATLVLDATAALADAKKKAGIFDGIDFKALDGAQAKLAAEIDKVQGAFDEALAVRDEVLAQDQLLASRIEQVSAMFGQIESTVNLFKDPTRWQTFDAFMNVWQSVNDLAASVGGDNALQLRSYVTPRTMSIAEVSQAIYRRTDKTFDILQINSIDDPMRIPASTTVNYATGVD